MLKRIITSIVLAVLLLTPVAQAQRFENYQIFGPLPQNDKGRQLEDCLASLDDFLYAIIGNSFSEFGSDFKDYWLDFSLSASHYADVYGVLRQLNKARYAVIASFMRCDVERSKQVNKQYYKLEAELYFVRHFIDTWADGFPDRLTLDAAREKFAREVVAYVTEKSPDPEDKDAQEALYSGYFNSFVAKYRAKIKQYKEDENESDPAWAQLKEKWDELMGTFKSFGTEVKGLGGDAKELGAAVVPDGDKPSDVLYSMITGLASKFDACAETDDERYCASDAIKYLNEHDLVKESEQQRAQNMLKTNKVAPKSFGDVLFAVDEQKRDAVEDMSETEMLTRYEVLYGRIGGTGINAIIERADTLNTIISTGSMKPLEKLYQCADNIEDKQCK